MTTPNDSASSILATAKEYRHSVTPQAVLEPHKEAILLLRAKYASYETITETLRAHGVQVSGTTVRMFCRRHQAEAKRVRASLEADRKAAAATAKGLGVSPMAPPERPPLSPEIGKRGPRIARDEL